jgi:phosphate transport system substrate-binding protein
MLILVSGLFLASCGVSGEPQESVYLRIAGANSMRAYLAALTSAYSTENPNVAFDLQGGGSEAGLELLRAGQVDMAASSWAPSEQELNRTDGTQQQLGSAVIGQDGLVLIVHPKNPVGNLSVAQIRGMFSGHVPDWREVGGTVGDVLVISREDGSGDRQAFENLIMDTLPVTLGAIVMPGSRDVVDYVSRHRNSIGYVSSGEITPEVKPLAIDGVEPTAQNIQDGSYPLWRLLVIIASDPPEGAVRDFLEFSTGPVGQEVARGQLETIR